MFGLHEDEGHAGLGPIGFDEGREGTVVTPKERIGGEGIFEVVEGGVEGWCPFNGGNRFSVEVANKVSERTDV